MNIIEILQDIFRDVFDDETLIISRKTSPEDIGDWDSLAQISIISTVQDVFKIDFDIREITEFSDVGSFIDVIAKKLNNG